MIPPFDYVSLGAGFMLGVIGVLSWSLLFPNRALSDQIDSIRSRWGDREERGTESLKDKVELLDSLIESRFSEISRLQLLSNRVNEAILFEETLEYVWKEFRDIIPYDRIGCALYNKENHTLQAEWAKATYPDVYLGKGYCECLTGSSLEVMLSDNTPRILNDLVTFAASKPSSHSIKLIRKEGGLSSMTCPLITVGGTRVGFLFFTSRRLNAYLPHHVTLFQQIAAMVSANIEKSRLYERILIEEQRSERLLHQILPPTIAARLKDGESPIADYHKEVGILFADLVGFTHWSASREPQQVVRILSEIFSEIDSAAENFGVVKIKTVGDEWMGAINIPTPNTSSVENLIKFAQRVTEIPRRVGLTFRVGVNVGECIAGVIGDNKIMYDVWGDTVNVASRMESSGEPERIHITESVAEMIVSNSSFVLHRRDPIKVKGKGVVQTFFVELAEESDALNS